MYYKILILLVLLLLLSVPVKAEELKSENTCGTQIFKVFNFNSKTKGEVFAYVLSADNFTGTTFKCIVATEFLNNVSRFPDKGSIILLGKSFTQMSVVKWGLKDNFFLVLQGDTETDYSVFTLYPTPLDRFKEFLLGQPLPNKEALTRSESRFFRTNKFITSKELNKKTLSEDCPECLSLLQ